MTYALKVLAGAVSTAAALGCAGAASAEAISAGAVAALGAGYTASDAPIGPPTELRIDLKGRIAPRCALTAPPAAMNGLPLDNAGENASAFTIDCNAPFKLRVVSRNGGFAASEAGAEAARVMPYDVSVDIATDAGRRSLGWCRAADLTVASASGCEFAPGSAGGWSSGEETAIKQTGALRMRWDSQAAATPAGAYKDTLVIELEVRS